MRPAVTSPSKSQICTMNNPLYPERLRDNNANGSVIKVERFLKDNVPKIFLLKVFNPTKSMHYYFGRFVSNSQNLESSDIHKRDQ